MTLVSLVVPLRLDLRAASMRISGERVKDEVKAAATARVASAPLAPWLDAVLGHAPGNMAQAIAAHDWENSSLGPASTWPAALRSAIGIMLTSRYAMWLGWGPDLTFLYNDAYAPTLGIKHPAALGRPAQDVWAEIWPDIKPRIDQVMGQGQATWDAGLRLLLERAGFPEETYHTFSYSPLIDDSGDIAGLFCVVTEETDRIIGERRLGLLRDLSVRLTSVRSEDEVLEAVEASLARASEDLPFALVYLNEPDGRARLARRIHVAADHPAAMADLGGESLWHSPAPSQARLVDGLDRRFDPELPRGPWATPPRMAAVVPLARGEERLGVLVAGLNPHRVYDDDYAGFLDLLAGQITSALAGARVYEEERRRAQALAELDRAKTLFFSNISHEFRTPLTLIKGPIDETIRQIESGQTDEIAALLDVARRNATRLQRMVNMLLDFSRVEAGRLKLHLESVDLSALTADIVSNFSSACQQAGLDLVIDCPPLPGRAAIDPEMWEKILLNLLSNAFKFTLAGEIRVTLRAAGRHAILTIRDTGLGIPEADIPRIFERFHRVEGRRGRTHEGSGIGLALVRELVILHGGTISLDSVVDEGTTFTITMPMADAAVISRSDATTGEGWRSQAPAFVDEALRWLPDAPRVPPTVIDDGAVSPAMARPDFRLRILVVDDNADMRAYLTRLLSRMWSVTAVADGIEALEAIRCERPDLVISDVMMPRLDGFGLLRELRADPELQTLPVILLSARAGEEAQVEGLASGANDYLVKPFSARELVARIKASLDMAAIRREAQQLLAARAAEFEAALSAVPNPVWFTRKADGAPVWGNRHAAELEEAMPRPFGHEHTGGGSPSGLRLPMAQRLLDRAAAGEHVRNEEQILRLADGTERVLVANASPLADGNGVITGAVCAAIDITARQDAETMLREQKRIVEMVAMGAPLDDTLAAVISLMEARRPDTSCGILVISEDGERFEKTIGQRLPPVFHETFRGSSLLPPFSGACAHAGFMATPILVPDIAGDAIYSPEWRQLMRESGLNAANSCPVMGSDGRVRAVFCAYSGDSAPPPTSDPEFYETATHLASIALERTRAESSLRAANERLIADNAMVERLNRELAGESDRLRALFEKAPSFMCILRGPNHIFELANDCYMELTGYRDLVGKAVRDAMPDVEGQGFFELLDEVYQSATPFTGQNAPVRLRRKADGSIETRYLNFVYQPIFNSAGDVSGIFVVGHDVTDRVTSEMELAERERQYRLLAAEQAAVLGQLAEGVIVIDPTGRVVFANDAAARIHGVARIELPLSQHGEVYGMLTREGEPYPAPDLPLARALIRDERVVNETWKIRRPDGGVAIAVGSASRVHAPDGHMIGAVLTFRDETQRETTVAALRESDLRQNLALAAGRMGVWDWDAVNDRLLWNERQCEIYGVDPAQFTGRNDDFTKRVHPDCRVRLRDSALAAYADDSLFESEFRIIRPSGEVRWVSTRSIALRDDKGRIVRAVGVNYDVTERRRAEEAQSLLIHELNHRVKNTLATVQSLAIQSFRNTGDPVSAREAFMARLLALSRAHNVLTRTNWIGAMLHEVVAQALQPFRTGDSNRFDIDGPDAQLTSKEALVLSMCLHELATNAMKYGALARASGTVRLRWTVSEGGRNLHLVWSERGGPKVVAPASRGFGSRLIEWGLGQELGGSARLDFEPHGLVCTIEAPLQSAQAGT